MKKELPTFMSLLRESWEEYKANWLLMAKVYAWGIVICILAVLAFVLVLGIQFFVIPQPYSFYILGMGILSGIGVMVYLGSWLNLSLAKASIEVGDGNTPQNAWGIYTDVKPLIWKYFLVQLLAGALVLSGYMLLIIPGIILSIWFAFSSFTFLVDGKRGVAALISSRDYMKNYATTVVLYFIGWGFITSVLLNMIPSYIFEQMDANWMSGILSLITSFVVAPLTIIFTYNIYQSLRKIKGPLKAKIEDSRKKKYYMILILPLFVLLGVIILAVNLISRYNGDLWDAFEEFNTHEEWSVPTDSSTIS